MDQCLQALFGSLSFVVLFAVSEALPSDLSSLSDMSSLTADLTKSLNSLPPI